MRSALHARTPRADDMIVPHLAVYSPGTPTQCPPRRATEVAPVGVPPGVGLRRRWSRPRRRTIGYRPRDVTSVARDIAGFLVSPHRPIAPLGG